MISHHRTEGLHAGSQLSELMHSRSDYIDLRGRLIQMGLALYLVPALLIVLVVGGVGVLVLTTARCLTGPIPTSLGRPEPHDVASDSDVEMIGRS